MQCMRVVNIEESRDRSRGVGLVEQGGYRVLTDRFDVMSLAERIGCWRAKRMLRSWPNSPKKMSLSTMWRMREAVC